MTAIAAEPRHPRPTTAERMREGVRARRRSPRAGLAALGGDAGRHPLGILDRQNATRVPELVPLRRERMAASAFTFYRGTAALMAADLAETADSGILVPSCGDAHVSNFGFYASPQRTLVFDMNDFDEAAWAPWEWDVKRLVTSVVVAGQATDRDRRVVRRAAEGTVRAYLRMINASLTVTPVQRYFTRFDLDATATAVEKQARRVLETAARQARKRTGDRAARRLTTRRGSELVFVEDPPTMTHTSPDVERRVNDYVQQYLHSAHVDIRMLMQHYEVTDVVHRVVGVGSVGTRCYLVALQDGDGNALILQAKEAGPSVLVEYGRVPQPPELVEHIERRGEGGRVVAVQRILQAASDPFLGYLRGDDANLYVRQFHDMKGGIEMDTLNDAAFGRYAHACGRVLGRAHAQSPHAAAVAGYTGGGDKVTAAIVAWAYAYAARSASDHRAFLAAGTR